MATSTHSLATQRYGLPSLWHLLSLDAPTVALLWFLLAARAAHIALHITDAAALALGTWMLYAIDRMLDAHFGALHLQEERHRFHGANQGVFLVTLACAVPALLTLLAHMEPRLLHAYLLLGTALAGYFMAIHTRVLAQYIPKELAVGVIFAAAIFMPELLTGFMPEFMAGTARAVLPQALCFGALCWLNCTLIYQREHANPRDAHWSTRFAIRNTSFLLAVLATAGLILFITGSAQLPGAAIAMSAAALLALHRLRSRMGKLPFRIAADAALLSPILLFLR
ncbi:MAG TPA: hypothetical protein VNU94_02320 [Acidobacteriaceae bacterium]|nr:hypothetical protein [Acidobacteriaceae bacterium]